MRNDTGLTLERGPATVIDRGQYAGEAVLPFTVVDGEIVAPYAVELAVKVLEESQTTREIHGLRISGTYLLFEEWDVRTQIYRFSNSSAKGLAVLVEHPRTEFYELFDTLAAQEKTDEHLRFAVDAPARGEATLLVRERRLLSRREEIRRQSAQALQDYLARGLLDSNTHTQLRELLDLWERVAAHERRLTEIEQERQKIYKGQEQVRGNMGALGAAGKEGELRAGYVDKLRASEQHLETLAGEEKKLQTEMARLKAEIEAKIKALG